MRNRKGRTALMRAAGNGFQSQVMLLIAAGANVFAQDSSGKTALDWARMARHDDVLHVLERATERSLKKQVWPSAASPLSAASSLLYAPCLPCLLLCLPPPLPPSSPPSLLPSLPPPLPPQLPLHAPVTPIGCDYGTSLCVSLPSRAPSVLASAV